LPLSKEAFQEYQELQTIIQNLQIQEHSRDKWTYIWGSALTPPKNSTYTLTGMSSLLLPFCGSRAQNAATS